MPESIWTVFFFGLEFIIRLGLAGLMLLRQRGRQSSRAAWIVVILALPLAGIVLYILIGEVRLGARRIRKHREITDLIELHMSEVTPQRCEGLPKLSSDYLQIAHLAELTGGNPPRGGNRLTLLGDTDLFIQSLVEDIDAARKHCHLLFYIFLSDHSGHRVGEALCRAANRGVTCRLLVDSVGSSIFLKSPLRRTLETEGVIVVEALPVSALRMVFARMDLRNHRKIAILDGIISYLGSHNISGAQFALKPKFAPWVDMMVRIEGPVSRDLQMLFVQDWYLDTEESLESVLEIVPISHESGIAAQILGTGPNCYYEGMRQVMSTAFSLSREELILTTPYFVPDEATAMVLRTAARRGVHTTLILPARNDSPLVAAASRSLYEPLLEAGVHIREYSKGLLHAKTLTIDRNLGLVSSANLDRRSFELNFEVSMVVYNSDFTSQLRFLQQSYLDDCQSIDIIAWRRRSWSTKLWQNAVGILSPLL